MAFDRVLGQRLARLDGPQQVLGEAQFVDDLQRPGLLHGAILRAAHPHARVLKVDVSRALRLRGVAGALTAADIPHNAYGPMIEDQPILCGDKVRYLGDPVAAVAAESLALAREALDLIRVEYEPLPSVHDPEEALRPGAPLLHENHPTGNLLAEFKLQKGDAEAAFAEADIVVEECYTTQDQEHAAIEPHVCLATADHTGKLTVYAATQRPFRFRTDLASVLQLPISKVRIISCLVGGGFGGKHEIMQEALAGLLALRTRRPVKFCFSREDEFVVSTCRHPFRMEYKTGVRRNGAIVAQQVRILADSGPYATVGGQTIGKGVLMAPGPYRVPNLRVEGQLVYTNNGIGGAVRGFGATQVAFASECHMESLALRLGMDPRAFRLKNALRPGDRAHSGDLLSSCALEETIEAATRSLGWDGEGSPAKREAGRPKRRGFGMASMIYPIGSLSHNPSAAVVRINEDGTATLWTGCVDVGQGSTVALGMIAAEELGIPFEHLTIVTGDTDLCPGDFGSVASRVTHIGGNAVRRAAARAKEQLLGAAASMLEAAVEDLEVGGGKVWVRGAPSRSIPARDAARRSYQMGRPLLAEGVYNPDPVPLDELTGQGKPFECYVFATHAAEVLVDVETGEVGVVRFVAAHDVGRAVNPLNVEGQIEGGSLQGLGLGLMEDILLEGGRALNPNLADYLIPTSLDVPGELRSVIVECFDPTGPFGAKGVAEPALNPTAPALLNAIRNACGAHITDLPATPERIWRAIQKAKGTSRP
ncbi:MAG: xanthine dehydrogenase family protein molybdopterin-binding subunit [Nitrospinota bacterium]